MSTQRRESLWQRRSCTERRGGSEQIWLIFLAWIVRAIATVGTAPPQTAKSLWTVRVATNSLQTDYRTTQFVRFVQLAREGIRPSLYDSPSPIIGD
ncbi:MAG: hypothetical protein WBQ94_09800, partial [Terracidiphilus sp.]